MAGDALRAIGNGLLGAVTGRQSYFLEVPRAATAAALSVVSFEAVERLGEPYKVTVRLTHPLELDRADYLNRNAKFVIDPGDGSEPRTFAGWISAFSKTRQTLSGSGGGVSIGDSSRSQYVSALPRACV